LRHDAASALALDHLLAHAQAVDAVVRGRTVLVDGLVHDLADEGRAHPRQQAVRLRLVHDLLQLRRLAAERGAEAVHVRRILEQDLDALGGAGNAGVGDAALAQHGGDLVGEGVGALLDRRLLVHFQQELHAAAQVQAHGHRPGTEPAHPVRHGRGQVERDVVVGAQLRTEQVGGLGLLVDVGGADDQVAVLDRHRLRADAGLVEGAAYPQHEVVVDDAATVGHHLHGRILRIEVGSCVEHRQQDDHCGQHVFPGGVLKHGQQPLAAREGPEWLRVGSAQADFNVPLGSTAVMAWRWTLMDTLSAISTVTRESPSSAMRPAMPTLVITSSPLARRDSSSRCSLARFIWSRIRKNQKNTNITPIMIRPLYGLGWAGAPAAWAAAGETRKSSRFMDLHIRQEKAAGKYATARPGPAGAGKAPARPSPPAGSALAGGLPQSGPAAYPARKASRNSAKRPCSMAWRISRISRR